MSAFKDALERCKLLAKNKLPPSHTSLINSYQSYQGNNTLPVVNNLKNNNFNKGLKYRIHTDEKMKLAQKWGILPRYLFVLCRDYGFYFVKAVISRVENIGDGYFRQNEDILHQRGKYCRAIILKEGKKVDDV